MSKIEVDAIEPQSGTTLTLGASGDSVALGSGASVSGLTLSDNILFDTASKGIYLGVTTATASNLLDDYEEGTFTPGIEGTTTAGTFTSNGGYTRGRYTKVGRLVQIYFGLVYSSFTGTGTMRLTGLPFASENTYMELPTSIINTASITKPTDTYIYGRLLQNDTKVGLFTQSTVTATRNGLAIDAAGEFYFTILYNTD